MNLRSLIPHTFLKNWKGDNKLSKKEKKYNHRAGTPSLIAGLTLAMVAAVAALFMSHNLSREADTPTSEKSGNSSPQLIVSADDSSEKTKPKPVERSGLEIRYLDVGQGDCSLILLPDGKNVLIDAGPDSSADYVVEYLKNEKIEKIDYLIATHPHEDHIGGMDEVINNFEIGRVYAPKIEESDESTDVSNEQPAAVTTKTYENFLNAVSAKGLKIINGKSGTHIYFSLSLTIDIIAPNSTYYSDINNYSLVVQMKYAQHRFLFMGDAENYSEQEILEGDYDIKANVIKIGHHGSYSASSNAFIEKVDPDYAIISCGKDNQYGHPHAETLKTLEKNEVNVLRTDLKGTIAVKSDGINELDFTTERDDSENSGSESGKKSENSDSSDNSEETNAESRGDISDESSGIESPESIAA